MADWTGTTALSVEDVAGAIRDGAFSRLNFVQRKTQKYGWRAIPDADGGVFSQFGGAPAWSGRATWQMSSSAAAYCDVEVYDRGNVREVVVTREHKFGAGGMSKRLMEGIVQAVG